MRLQTDIAIDRPAGEVFEVVSDMSLNTTWQKGMQSCVWTSAPPIAVGSTYDQVAGFGGKEILSSFRVTEFEPGRHIRIISTKSTFPLDITRAVTPTTNESCVVRAIVAGEPGGLMKLLNPLTKLLVRRSVKADYQRLKELLESP